MLVRHTSMLASCLVHHGGLITRERACRQGAMHQLISNL